MPHHPNVRVLAVQTPSEHMDSPQSTLSAQPNPLYALRSLNLGTASSNASSAEVGARFKADSDTAAAPELFSQVASHGVHSLCLLQLPARQLAVGADLQHTSVYLSSLSITSHLADDHALGWL